MENCVFCNFKPNSPLMLHCGHLICQKCAQVCQQPISPNKSEIVCFQCQIKTEFTTVEDLQQLQIIETQMMDTQSDHYENSNKIQDFQDYKSLNCYIHSQEYSLFCQTCRLLCCIECVHDTNNHKKHHILSLKQALSIISNDNQLFLKKQKNNIKKLDEAIQVCTYNQNFFTNQKKIIQEYVILETQRLITQLKQKEQEILENLDTYIDKNLISIQQTLDSYLNQRNNILQFKSNSQDKETLIFLFNLQNTLAKQSDQIQIPDTLNNNNIIDFSSAKEISNSISKFGQFIKIKPTKPLQSQRKNSLSRNKSQSRQALRQINITNKENKRSQKQLPQHQNIGISRQVTPQKTPIKTVQKQVKEKRNVPLDSEILQEYDYNDLENILPQDLDQFQAISFDEFFTNVPKKVLGLVEANSYKFGWYWNVDSIKDGYNRGECYIFTLKNYINSLVRFANF